MRCRITPISNTGISNVPPAEFSFCWGGVCYGSGTDTSGQVATLTAGQFVVYPDLPAHSGYFDAFCDPSSGEIEYCFYDDANPNLITKLVPPHYFEEGNEEYLPFIKIKK